MIQFNIQFKTISRKVILSIIHSKHYKNCRSWQPRNTSVQNVKFKWQKCPVSPVCIPCKLEVVYTYIQASCRLHTKASCRLYDLKAVKKWRLFEEVKGYLLDDGGSVWIMEVFWHKSRYTFTKSCLVS